MKRSPTTSFPLVPLPEAVEKITEVAKYGKKHSRSAFAQHLGHESAYSGPFKTKLAAYRDWGLVTTGPDAVELSALAVRLALPPDPDDVAGDWLEAFRSCRPFVSIYDACAKGQPLALETIANMAVHRVGISPTAKAKFANSFASSVTAAGLGERVGENTVVLHAEQLSDQQTPDGQEPQPVPPSDASPPAMTGPRGSRAVAVDAAVSLSWPIDDGEITFVVRREQALPSRAFAQLARVTDVIEELAAELSASTAENTISARTDE